MFRSYSNDIIVNQNRSHRNVIRAPGRMLYARRTLFCDPMEDNYTPGDTKGDLKAQSTRIYQWHIYANGSISKQLVYARPFITPTYKFVAPKKEQLTCKCSDWYCYVCNNAPCICPVGIKSQLKAK